MKLPTSVLINGRRWKVKRVEPNTEWSGLCVYAERTIYITTDLDDRDAQETFLHELLHALLPEREFLWSEKLEELVIHMLAPRLVTTLKDMGCWK